MLRVLVVEDHELLSRYLCATILARGHDVRCANTRAEAMESLKQHDYDIVVCDLILPDGTGLDVARLAEDRGIKTLRITGHPDEFAKMRKTGVRCLYKPFGSDQLFAALYAEINRRPSISEQNQLTGGE